MVYRSGLLVSCTLATTTRRTCPYEPCGGGETWRTGPAKPCSTTTPRNARVAKGLGTAPCTHTLILAISVRVFQLTEQATVPEDKIRFLGPVVLCLWAGQSRPTRN